MPRASLPRALVVLALVPAALLSSGRPAAVAARHATFVAPPPVPTAQPAPAPTATLSIHAAWPELCPGLLKKGVPQAAIDAAVGGPEQVGGWNQPRNPNVPVSIHNPRRRHLSIVDANKRYHPLYNGLTFRAGCP